MSINKDFYERYENGLTAKVHFMRWIYGIGLLSPLALLAIAIVFGGKLAVFAALGTLALIVFPYVVGGMFYDMKMMDKHGVVYK